MQTGKALEAFDDAHDALARLPGRRVIDLEDLKSLQQLPDLPQRFDVWG